MQFILQRSVVGVVGHGSSYCIQRSNNDRYRDPVIHQQIENDILMDKERCKSLNPGIGKGNQVMNTLKHDGNYVCVENMKLEV